MKKLYWVNLILICSILLTSCTTLFKNNDLIVDTALNLANKQVELGQYSDALLTYDEALKHGLDYRLIYNKAIVQSLLNDYQGAIETAEKGYKLYKDKSEFLLELGNLYYMNNQIDSFISAFNQYFSLNEKNTDAKVQFMKLCYDIQLNELAYETALSLWESGTYTKDVVSILYSINNDEWFVVNKLFN